MYRMTLCCSLFLLQGVAFAQLPPIPDVVLSDPEATGPGVFPNATVTSAYMQVVSPPGVMNAGGNQDEILVSLPQQGPLPWTTNRYNEGDVAIQLSPNDVGQANEFLGTSPPWPGSAAEREYKYEDPTSPQTQVWNLNPDVGVVLATAAQNVVSWDDGLDDYFPVVALARSSSGRGYNMVSGEWGAGGIDVNLGTWGDVDEANFSTAMAWFPYEQGWVSGWMGNTDSGGTANWAGGGSFSPQLGETDLDSLMVWTDLLELETEVFSEDDADFGALGKFSLAELGINSATDGMLFTNSADGSSSTNITSAAPLPDGSGWQFTAREDSQMDSTTVAAADQASFSFVYVPYDANGLVGGHIDGDDASMIGGSGNFAVTRTGDGSYDIQIAGKTDQDGVLMLSNADFLDESMVLADNSHLSYEWNAEAGSFSVEARHFDGEVQLEDTDFYFMWVDFNSPLSLEPSTGDIQIDDLCSAIGSGANSLEFDLTGDGVVDEMDLTAFLSQSNRVKGDTDFDGSVEFADFLVLSGNFGLADQLWSDGDFDCNARVEFADFLSLSGNFGKTANAAAVPEPTGLLSLLVGLLLVAAQRRRRLTLS